MQPLMQNISIIITFKKNISRQFLHTVYLLWKENLHADLFTPKELVLSSNYYPCLKKFWMQRGNF